jgi:hypothetical protein
VSSEQGASKTATLDSASNLMHGAL